MRANHASRSYCVTSASGGGGRFFLPVHEERHACASLKQTVLAAAESAVGVVYGACFAGAVLISVVEYGTVVAYEYHDSVVVQTFLSDIS